MSIETGLITLASFLLLGGYAAWFLLEQTKGNRVVVPLIIRITASTRRFQEAMLAAGAAMASAAAATTRLGAAIAAAGKVRAATRSGAAGSSPDS